MPYTRRNFLIIGFLGGLVATSKANSCAISWAQPIGLDSPDTPRPTTDTIETFLNNEFGQAKWQVARDEHMMIQTPLSPESNGAIPLTIFLPSGTCSSLSIYLESHVPYRGTKWSHALLSRKVKADELSSSLYLAVRRKILAFNFPKTGVSEVSTRFRAMRADYHLIVAAEFLSEDRTRNIFIRQSPLVKELAPHCGGVYFVDTQREAETTSCFGYGDKVCPGDSWGAR